MRKSPSPFSYHMSLYVENKMEFLAVGKTCRAIFSPPKFFKERMFNNTVFLIAVSVIPHNWCLNDSKPENICTFPQLKQTASH